MLAAMPTPKGTGVEFWGDYSDLYTLRDVMNQIALSSLNENADSIERNERLLSIMPYELRHAFQGSRYTNHNINNGPGQTTTYYGFRINWITLLYTIAVLRYNTSRMPTDEITQGILYITEHLTRKSMFDYDIVGATVLEQFIGKHIYVEGNYTYLIHHSIAIDFLKQKPGKKRFRLIPNLLRKAQITSPEYKKMVADFERRAAELGCKTTNLDFDEYNDSIVW